MRARKTWIYISCSVFLFIFIFINASPVLAGEGIVMDELRQLIDECYVDDVDVYALKASTPQELVQALGDPHSMYLSAEEYQQFLDSLEGVYGGIGIYIDTTPVPQGIRVMDIIAGYPAEEAGILPGDIIKAVDGTAIGGMLVDDSRLLITGPVGKAVELDIQRNEETLHFRVMRKGMQAEVIAGALLDFHTGYIDLNSFALDSAAKLESTWHKWAEAGTDKLIIDLRQNPGGHLVAAQQVGGCFIGSSPILQVKEKGNEYYLLAEAGKERINVPAAVLIDGNSASAAEILAAALQDYERAVLIGEKTYGKGSIQKIYPLSNGDWAKLTTAQFYSPRGTIINHKGIIPDVEVDSTCAVPAAELLLADPEEHPAGTVTFVLSGYEFTVDLQLARDSRYWKAWSDIAEEIDSPVFVNMAQDRCFLLDDIEEEQIWQAYYPGYILQGEVCIDKAKPEIELYTPKFLDADGLQQDIRVVEATGGRTVPFSSRMEGADRLCITLAGEILQGEYWMLIDGFEGSTISQPNRLIKVLVN